MADYDFLTFKDALAGLRFSESCSKGRFSKYDEDSCFFQVLNPYILDVERKIMNSKATRRGVDKTQVFSMPDNKHVRNRNSHMQEVTAISVIIAESLGLNPYLCRAIADSHDLGHFLFGHIIEDDLTYTFRKKTGNQKLSIDHAFMGPVLTNMVERKGRGLNLCYETTEGALCHSGPVKNFSKALPQEYNVVKYADKIAFTFSDFNDGVRIGLLKPDKYDKIFKLIKMFGTDHRERVLACVYGLCKESAEKGFVSFADSATAKGFAEFKTEMSKSVYKKIDWDLQKLMVEKILDILLKSQIDDYIRACEPKLKEYNLALEKAGLSFKPDFLPDPVILLSCLTDNDAYRLMKIKNEKTQLTLDDIINETPLFEIAPYLLFNPLLQHENMLKLYISWGEYEGREHEFFREKFVPVLKEHYSTQLNINAPLI